jgi:glutamine synthetase
MDPGPANDGNLYETPEEELHRRGIRFLPATLQEAVECFRQDSVVCEALGTDYAAYYAGVKSEEWRRYHQSVSEWEIAEYLKTY